MWSQVWLDKEKTMKKKMVCLLAFLAPVSVVYGCAGTVHTVLIHANELTQLAAALSVLGCGIPTATP